LVSVEDMSVVPDNRRSGELGFPNSSPLERGQSIS
jgi:hypothetical protein